MCNVKSGVLVENRQDVQNLVIGIIFRQQYKYKIENIVAAVQYYMKGSSVTMDTDSLREIISDNLNLLHRNDKIKRKNGYYIPRSFDMLKYMKSRT